MYLHPQKLLGLIQYSYIFLYNPSGCVMMCPSNPVEKSLATDLLVDVEVPSKLGILFQQGLIPGGTWRPWRPTNLGG